MGDERRVVVLGGGIGGASTAYFLSREPGVQVTLVEKEPRHDQHSSGRSAEILRVAIDDPITRALGLATSELLERPASIGLDATGPLVDRSGLFVITDDADPEWRAELVAAGECEPATSADLERSAPHARAVGAHVHWLPRGGRVHGQRVLTSLLRGAFANGTRAVRSAGPAVPLAREGSIVGVELPGRGRIEADDVVIAAGAWSGVLGEALGAPLPLRTTLRHMFRGQAVAAGPGAARRAPVVWDDAAGAYARVEEGHWLLSICDTVDASAGAPPLYPIDHETRARALHTAARVFPGAKGLQRFTRSWTGFRDLAPDDRPFLGPDPRVKGLAWCAGLGGHGFTVSLAAGQVAADAILGRGNAHAAAAAPCRGVTLG